MILSLVATLAAVGPAAWLALAAAAAAVGPTGKAALARESARRKAAANRARWRDDPVAYARERLGVELWAGQVRIATDVAGHSRVSVRTGHKLGKSTLLVVLALWWFETRDRALVILSSGNATQVRIVLWRELTRLHRAARASIGGTLHRDPASGLTADDGRAIFGITAADAERFAGFSSPDLLIIIDEASGFDDALIETALGNLAGGGRIVLAGNPTRVSGFFARTHREQMEAWRLHHISALESPNVTAGQIVVPGLATAASVAEMASDFGADSAAYAVRVLGEFASQGDDAVIALASVERATGDWSPSDEGTGPLEIGVDPARFGDDESVIVGRRGKHALPAATHRKLDNVEVAARALEYMRAHARPGEAVVFRIDEGGLGSGVVDILRREVGILARVEAINSASAAKHSGRFANARAELWWATRKWLERGGTMPADQRRDAELLAPRFSHDAKMRIVIESKDAMRARLRRSPDRADALALACYSESPLSDGESRPSDVDYSNTRRSAARPSAWGPGGPTQRPRLPATAAMIDRISRGEPADPPAGWRPRSRRPGPWG